MKQQRLKLSIGPLHDPVTWYKITYTGEQVAQWDFQNKGRCIVLEVPLCNLLTSICNFVPCDRVMLRAYCSCQKLSNQSKSIVLYSVFCNQSTSSPDEDLQYSVNTTLKILITSDHVMTEWDKQYYSSLLIIIIIMSLLLSQIRCADICSELTLLEQGINKVSSSIMISTTPNNCTIPVQDKKKTVKYYQLVSLSHFCCK